MARSPGRSPGEAVFDRELTELRLLDALVSNYEAFTAVAIAGSLVTVDQAYLQDEWTTLVLDPTMQTAVADGFEDVASAYFGQLRLVFDVVDTLTAVHDYATGKGLTKRATRNLMRESIRLDARALEPVPAELMTVGAKGSPRLAVKGLPFVERGMSTRSRFEAVARTVATGMDGWAARAQAQKTGDHLRWVTMRDDKVRPAHVHAQGQTVPPDEPFYVGGWPMWYPGDPDAPEDLTVNCRCVLASIEPNPNRRYVQRYVPSEWLNAAGWKGNPSQARAPKGSSIGGQWIETPTAILRSLNRLESGTDLGGEMRSVEEMKAERRRLAAEVLEREGRPSLDETAQRVEDIYGMTTAEQRAAGKEWYSEATALAQEMVDDPATDLTLEQSAAILAHLSTQTRWEANAVYARAMAAGMDSDQALATLKAAIAAGTVPKPRLGGDFVLDRNWNKALSVFGHPDPIGRANDTLGTFTEFNKTRTFASNIMGDSDGVTMDSHMEDIVGQALRPIGKMEGLNQKLRSDMVYESLSEAVRVAADNAGISPAEMQAVTWTWGMANRVDARTDHPARLVDEVTGTVLPVVIGGEQALIESGDLVADALTPEPPLADEPSPVVPDYWYAQAEKLLGLPRQEADEPPPSSLDVPIEFTVVGWFDPETLTASAAQARAPKGTSIGGQWIDTPSGILNSLGLGGEEPDAPIIPYDVPVVKPDTVIPGRGVEHRVMVEAEAANLNAEMPPPPPPPPPVVEAIHAYTDGRVAAALNGGLRKPPPEPGYDDMIDNLDAAIASGECPEDMYVYRLVPRHLLPHPTSPYEGLDDPKSVVGVVISDKGYLSTSIDPLGSGDYSSKTLLRIAVPKGHPVAWVKPYSQNPKENEVLLGRDTALAITAIGVDDWGDPVYEAVIAYAAVSASLTAAGPDQARAPKGTPIGGEWIETPGALLTLVRDQGGASIDPLTGLQPTDGFMVAVQGFNEEVPEEEFFASEDRLFNWIAERQEQLTQPGAHVGLWHDTANGEVVLDVSQRVDTVEEAVRLGQERNQQSVWDVANGVEIPTGGTGDRQASAYRMDDHDRLATDAAPHPTGPADEHRPPGGLLRVGRGAPAGVRASGDRGAESTGVTAALVGLHLDAPQWPEEVDMASRFAEPPTVDAEVTATAFAFSPSQARAPKGTSIGGQWLETAHALLNKVKGPPSGGAPGPLVESTGPQVLRTENGLYKEFEPTTTGDDEGVPEVRNDEGMDHTDLASGATDPKGRPYGDDVIQRANEIHTQAILAEPKLTADMRAAMQGSGGELGGLEYRIKNQASLAKKIRANVEEGKPFETQNVTDNIKDSVRYTAIFDEGEYVSGTQTAIQRLREQGYQVDVKSFYVGEEAGLAYKGVHGQAISPEGFKVELQFHTPASLEAKFSPEMHKVYDAQKLVPKGSAEWESYEQNMRDYMTGIGFTSPPGAETIA